MRLGPYTSFLLVHFIAPTSLQHMPPVSLALYVPFQAAVCHCLSVRSPHSPCSFLSWNVTGAPQLRECLINLSASKSDAEPGWGDESGDSGWIWHSSLCRHAQAPPCSTHCLGEIRAHASHGCFKRWGDLNTTLFGSQKHPYIDQSSKTGCWSYGISSWASCKDM